MDGKQHPGIAAAIEVVGSQAELARRCGCTQQTISKLLLRQIALSAELAQAIHKATAGEVPKWELRPDLWDTPTIPEAAASRRTPVRAAAL